MIWDEVPTRKEYLRRQGEDAAATMRGEQPAAPPMRVGDLPGQVNNVVEQLRQAFPGATVNVSGSGSSAPQAGSAADYRVGRLERLAGLRDSGVLTAEEFEREKARILGEG